MSLVELMLQLPVSSSTHTRLAEQWTNLLQAHNRAKTKDFHVPDINGYLNRRNMTSLIDVGVSFKGIT